MMILRSSPASPFGRKVQIAVALLGLKDEVEFVAADTNDASDALRQQNPLGKIPTLILESGKAIFDSRVIVDYLDSLAGGGRVVPEGPARLDALILQALADGIMDACLLQVYERRFRDPDKLSESWLGVQAGKVERALAALETETPTLPPTPHVGVIALACALGYLDLRFEGRWRAAHPNLVNFLDTFAGRVPAFEDTRVKS
ncbi:MAG: glutathione S-transferase [Rhizobiales bacterium 65-9]|nr:glutathione S-transferase N-terminal domain-containing protein [Hyphomicrobiales bacterium]OJY32883.1 MAG: glutathione S-transferase [Rhizobiales bacterium 65-9]